MRLAKIKSIGGGYMISINGDIKRSEKVHKRTICNAGYFIACLSFQGKRKRFMIHRLIFECFVKKIPRGHQINHIDGNKLNNKISNLEIVTPRQNIRHGIKTGLIDTAGESNAMAKISQADAIQIKELKGKLNDRETSLKFKISRQMVNAIRNNKRWRHLK
jgi:hypothetical protein